MSGQPTNELLLKTLGALPQTGQKADVDAVSKNLTDQFSAKHLLHTWLNKQGLPAPSLKNSTINSLALAYVMPAYLKSWRNRVNPNWALLGGEDDEDDYDNESFGKSTAAGGDDNAERLAQAQTANLTADPKAMQAMANQVADALLAKLDAKVTTVADRVTKEFLRTAKIELDPNAKAQIAAIARESAEAWAKANRKPQRIEIINVETGETKNLGLQHESFPTLLRAAQAKDHRGFRLNIWLTGPTGSGKTTAGENVAKALGLKFGSDGSLDADYKVLGFRDANGNIISTQFLDIFANGGIYLADEIDNWLPSALLALNAALANGFVSSPGGLIRRHPDCLVIACANTWGHGATNEYVGRTKQDAATLDRFQPKIHWPVDERLERALAEAQAGDLGLAWVKIVQVARRTVARQGLKIIISPRATFSGLGLLRAGFDKIDTMHMTFLASLSPEQANPILAETDHIDLPSAAPEELEPTVGQIPYYPREDKNDMDHAAFSDELFEISETVQ
jgi:hypothetical protein